MAIALHRAQIDSAYIRSILRLSRDPALHRPLALARLIFNDNVYFGVFDPLGREVIAEVLELEERACYIASRLRIQDGGRELRLAFVHQIVSFTLDLIRDSWRPQHGS